MQTYRLEAFFEAKGSTLGVEFRECRFRAIALSHAIAEAGKHLAAKTGMRLKSAVLFDLSGAIVWSPTRTELAVTTSAPASQEHSLPPEPSPPSAPSP